MLAAVDAATGVLVSELEIRADEGGHRRALPVGARVGDRTGVGDRGLSRAYRPRRDEDPAASHSAAAVWRESCTRSVLRRPFFSG